MRFDWDESKSEANREKHGVDFAFVVSLWDSPVLTSVSNRKGERRRLSIGRIGGEYWTVIWEPRDGATRIISARLSTPKERSCYDRNHR